MFRTNRMDETQLLGTDGEIPTNKEKGEPLLLLASPLRLETKLALSIISSKAGKEKLKISGKILREFRNCGRFYFIRIL